jgi:hypothetical protein
MDKKTERDAKRTITMKTKLNSLLITAAGLALTAAAAYGQTRVVANVPFSFRTAAGVQPAGEYQIATVSNDGAVAILQNTETGHSTLTGMGSPNGNPNDKTPRLVFRCGTESGCTLSEVKMGDGRGWTYKTPHLKPSETERAAVIYFESKQAE